MKAGGLCFSVMLQPFDYNAEEKSKHKFMVQTAFVPEGETSLDNIWKNITTADLMDSKLRVVFEMPESSNIENVSSKLATPQKPVPPLLLPSLTNLRNKNELHVQVTNSDADLRKAVDDKKRLQSDLQRIQEENAQLRVNIN